MSVDERARAPLYYEEIVYEKEGNLGNFSQIESENNNSQSQGQSTSTELHVSKKKINGKQLAKANLLILYT